MQTDKPLKIQKGGIYMKGQVATGLGLTVIALVAIATAVFIFSQVRETRVVSEGTTPPVIWEPVEFPEVQPLSPETEAKQESLLAGAGIAKEGAGDVATQDMFRVEYIGPVPSAPWPTYLVEILDTDIAAAKQAAEQWFLDQGFTEEEVCQLRTTYFLSWDVKQSLPPGTRFDPLPSFCR